MAKKNLFMIMSALVLLSGCATMHHEAVKHDQDYLTQSKTVPVTKVPATSTTNMQSYYPIPPVNGTYSSQSVNIIPPGSQLPVNSQPQQRAAMAAPAPNTPVVVASSSSAIVLNAPYAQAWDKVGQGLKASGYKVMEKDRSMGAYYILDLAGSDGVLKTNTPIYRVNVKASGATTSISLVDGQNNPVNAAISSRILGALKQKL